MNSDGKQQWCLNQPYYQPKTLGDEENSFGVLTVTSPFESQSKKFENPKKQQIYEPEP